MREEIQLDQVNRHYLDKVMDLAEELDVEATEDIFDARGMKLIAKGAQISRALQQKLILHKLRKPLESCIAVHGGINTNMVLIEAQRISDTIEPIACLFKATSGKGVSPLDIIRRIELGSAMSMMLTIVERGGAAALEHSVMVSLMSICFARKLGLSEENQKVAALAGLLHDIGELYIAPEYLKSDRRLLPHEWRHVVVHPRIGQMLIDELESYSPAVGLAIAEHHERLDGAGYPRQVSGNAISPAGSAVSVAEMISALYIRPDRPLERAELALKIIPGEHARDLVSALTNALRVPHEANRSPVAADEATASLHQLSERIGNVLQIGDELIARPSLNSPRAQKLLAHAMQRTRTIERAFISTGLDSCVDAGIHLFDSGSTEVKFEAALVATEIEWRLREVARDLALHSDTLDDNEVQAIQSLIAMLDQAD